MTQKQRRPGGDTEAPINNELGQILSHLPPSRKDDVAALLRSIAALVESTPEAPAVDTDAPKTIAQLQASGRHITPGWARTHVLEAGRGPRRTPLYRPSDVDAALASGAQPPRPPRKSRPIATNEDPIDQMLASGELVARRGAR